MVTVSSDLKEAFKRVMRQLAQSVFVITTGDEKTRTGVTVSSFTSVSIDPPLVLVSIARGTPSHDPLVGSFYFAVNVLGEEQSWVSERFAGKTLGENDKFEGIRYRLSPTRLPLIDDALAWLECRKWANYDGGDHTLILGEVLDAEVARESLPLVYHNRRYTTVALPAKDASEYESLLMEW